MVHFPQAFFVFTLAVVALFGTLVHAQDDTDKQMVRLLTDYAPRVWLAKGDRYKPSTVEWAFKHLKRVKRDDGRYWLETKQALKEPSDNTLELFTGNLKSAPVYSFWIDKSTKSQKIVDLAYFFYYPYNRGKEVANTKFGNHVGDWEHITVRLIAAANSAGKLSYTPEKVYVSAHDFGGEVRWDKVPKLSNTTHPIVFSAEGSHGCYLEAGTKTYKEISWILKLSDQCSEGTVWDTFYNVKAFDFNNKKGIGGSTWPIWMSDDYTSPGNGADPADPASGPIYRWGNKAMGFKVPNMDEYRLNNGPTGPIDKSGVWDPKQFK